MWQTIWQFFTSLRLTLGLLLGIALVSIAGTVNPPENGRFDLFYQSAWFRLLFVFLAANLTACTIKTIRRNLSDRARGFSSLSATEECDVLSLGEATLDEARGRLREAGYRITSAAAGVVGVRGELGRWGSTIVHLSCLVIMAGALSAGLGFVGTLNLTVGDKSASYFDWKAQDDRPLGFEFRLDHFEPLYYPIELQFAVLEPGTGKTIATLVAHEGDIVALPDGLSVRIVRYFFFEEDLVLELYQNNVALGEYHALGGKRMWEKNPKVPFEFKPVAYRDPIVKQLRSEVSILEGGKVVKKGVIEVNQPLEYQGVMVYQTAYNRDKFGFWSAGFQFSRDPGKSVVWFGCITLVIGLLLAFAIPFRVVGLVERSGLCRLLPITGFRGEAGEGELLVLRRKLGAVD